MISLDHPIRTKRTPTMHPVFIAGHPWSMRRELPTKLSTVGKPLIWGVTPAKDGGSCRNEIGYMLHIMCNSNVIFIYDYSIYLYYTSYTYMFTYICVTSNSYYIYGHIYIYVCVCFPITSHHTLYLRLRCYMVFLQKGGESHCSGLPLTIVDRQISLSEAAFIVSHGFQNDQVLGDPQDHRHSEC